MLCNTCGKELPANTRFCPNCGQAQAAHTSAVPPAQTSAQTRPPYAQTPPHAPIPPQAAYRAQAQPQPQNQPQVQPRPAYQAPIQAQERPPYQAQLQSQPAPQPFSPQQSAPPAERAERRPTRAAAPRPKAKKKTVPLLLGGGVLLVAVLLAILVPTMINKAKQERYAEAERLWERGKLEEAGEIFADLGSFEDAAERAEEARKTIAYDAALEQLDAENYAEAKAAFEALADYKDSAAKAEFAAKLITFDEAEAHFEKEEYEAAMALYQELGSFLDAANKAKICDRELRSAEADKLFDAGKFEDALKIYTELNKDWSDKFKDKASACQKHVNYDKGVKLLNEGEYFAAYQVFSKLKDFEDAADQASSCLQAYPASGVTYQNPAYSGGNVELRIEPPSSDGSRNYLKIYAENNDLVACVAIERGEAATVWLPGGKFKIKSAFSFEDLWFGEADLFGDDAYYNVLVNDQTGDEFFALEDSGSYTLNLRTGGDGTPVRTETEGRKSF